jgi:kumamolisin
MSSARWSPIAGSAVRHLAGVERAAAVDARKHLRVTVVLRPRNELAHRAATALPPSRRAHHALHPAALHALTRTELADLYDPGEDRFELVRAFARAHDLKVVEVSRARHDVVLEGSVRALNRAFGVTLHHFSHEHGRYRAYEGSIQVPQELADVVEGILGLDDVPVHRPRTGAGVARLALTPAQLANHYGFPAVDASAQRIALVQFSGGFHNDDLKAYADLMGLRLPVITEVPVEGADGHSGQNAPLSPDRTRAIAAAWKEGTSFTELHTKFGADLATFMATMEVTMDLQLAVALGGGAAVDVYFAPQGKDGWRRVLYAAIGEPVGSTDAKHPPVPTVLSVSWGDSESAFGPMALRVVNDTLVAVERKGVLVCCSSGDRGASNEFPSPSGSNGSAVNVNFPASSPVVLACGGTSLLPAHGASDLEERAWRETMLGLPMASGGGMSGFFARPAHQSAIDATPLPGTWRADGTAPGFVGRWVPDVAANASFESGAAVVVGGEELSAGGTSAATPLCAALLTRVSAAVGHSLAGLAPWLYEGGRTTCTDITKGTDDVSAGPASFYRAASGWDACTGLGAPNGRLLSTALAASAPNK